MVPQWSHEFTAFTYCKNKINRKDSFDLVYTTFTLRPVASFPKLWQLSPSKSKGESAPTMYTWVVVDGWSLRTETMRVSVNWGRKDHSASLFSTHLTLYSSLTCVRAMCIHKWMNKNVWRSAQFWKTYKARPSRCLDFTVNTTL